MTEPWLPLDLRDADDPDAIATYEGPFEGVPKWIELPLLRWVETHMRDVRDPLYDSWHTSQRLVDQMASRLRTPLPEAGKAVARVRQLCEEDPQFLLKVIDYLLAHELRRAVETSIHLLKETLEKGGSVWTVQDTREPYGLTRRIDPTITEAINSLAEAGAPGRHLARAWSNAYGLNPNPVVAYDHAIKAVEAAARPVVLPDDSQGSLGKIYAALRDGRSKFETRLEPTTATGKPPADSVGAVVEMCGTLLHSQRGRHADPHTVEENSQEEAEDAVHLALLLVQWFRSGAIVRVG